MNILFVLHQDNTLGVIPDWASDRGHNLKVWGAYKNDPQPETGGIDFLIVGGGPQSILDLDEYPYLSNEIELIKNVVKEDKPVLGICLGAQLVGEAFGAKGERSPNKEIGIFPVLLEEEGMSDPLLKGFPSSFQTFHRHSDMPGVSDDAVVLAHSKGCPRQIVRYSPKVYGFQCHLEFGQASIENMAGFLAENSESGRFIQNPDVMLAQDHKAIHNRMFTILDRMIELSA